MTPWIRYVRLLAVIALGVAALLVAPAAATAHAELVTASPADGETVVGTPAEIHATYSENLNPDGSALGLLDPSGARVARGGVVPDGGPKEMFIRDLPSLAPGVYTVRSTTRSAEDGDIERVTWSFTVAAPAVSATPEPATSEAPSPTPGQTPSPTASPTPAPTTAATPSPSPAPGTPTGSGSDVIVPIIVALAIVAVGGSFLIARGRRPGPPA